MKSLLSILCLQTALVLIMTLSHSTVLCQTPDSPPLPIGAIEFNGLKDVSRDQSIAATGLHIGQRITKSDMEKAIKDLHDSGLFARVQYRYRQYDDRFEITFLVVEWPSSVPVIYDNFIWFTDKELMDAVKKELPTFDGSASQSPAIVDSIKRALKRLLQDHKIPGEIDFTDLSPDVYSRQTAGLVFAVKGVSIPICSLHYQTTGDIPEHVLVANTRGVIAKNYSLTELVGYLEPTKMSLYGKSGYLRASFDAPVVTLRHGNGCTGGVDVSIKVNQGIAYNWDRVQWSDNKLLTAAALDKAMQMRPGEIADATKIQDGLVRIIREYGRSGYLVTKLKTSATFNDPSHAVTYAIAVDEGDQFHMGKLTLAGATEAEAKLFLNKWELHEGDVYDESFAEEFLIKIRTISYPRSLGNKKLSFSSKLDREAHTVNIMFEFK
jgi:outer membrane protein assembly factor BamA